MMTSSQHKRPLYALTHWVLVLALLLGQSFALAHDHDSDHDFEGSCALCLYSQNTDDMVQAFDDAPANRLKPYFVSSRGSQHFVAIFSSNYHSRAPPCFS